MRVPFTKMQGLGNDFVLLDERAGPFGLNAGQLRRLADRRYGVGCDQVLLIDRPSLAGASVRYRVFNADGSAAQHCGNGVRCVASYLVAHNAVRGEELRVEIADSTYELKLAGDGNVTVDMGEPDFEPAALPMNAPARAPRYSMRHAGRDWVFGAVSMGNPHAVFPVADLDHAPVVELGSRLQDDPLFPQRVNVGFMQIVDAGRIRLRVFERGAGETPACGTGACGAVAIGRLWGELTSRVVVELTGGELVIEWDGPDSRLWMRGPAVTVFEGTIEL